MGLRERDQGLSRFAALSSHVKVRRGLYSTHVTRLIYLAEEKVFYLECSTLSSIIITAQTTNANTKLCLLSPFKVYRAVFGAEGRHDPL